MTVQRSAWKIEGFTFLIVVIAAALASVYALFSQNVFGIFTALFAFISMPGFFVINPNESRVFTFFGRYVGSTDEAGFWWTNPLAVGRRISRKVYNFNSQQLKVNDAAGSPIEIAAVVVWRVVDTACAIFDVENYGQFVSIQSETAIRSLASRYAYDSHDESVHSLRGNQDEVAQALKAEVQERLKVAGVQILETRISHLAYAPEIAQAMLRRQQAQAIIAARQQIVDGAVGMVEMALKRIAEKGIVTLTDERKATMVNNLLVVLTSETEAQPVLNAGTLHN